jgi:site-specific DNA-adenine methylase
MNNFIGLKRIGQNKKAMEKLLKKKSVATLKKELQEVFNKYIRIRDTKTDKGQPYFICISCGEPKGLEQMNAGHYWPVGGHEAVRYDEDNVHGQCIYCNNFASNGMVTMNYAGRLLTKIGKARFEALALRRFNRSKLMPFELELLIQEYKTRISNLKP